MWQRFCNYLAVVFAIFKRDALRIVRNPVALVLLVGACALPSAYAWFCTAANWDPYQNTQAIRIAVCSEDEGARLPAATGADEGPMNIGSKIVDELKSNDELGWAFYDSAEEAVNSVYAGESYAAIVIPKNFSGDFMSILSGDFHQPQVDYYLNEKISASAPDFTNEGATVIQEDINQSFVDTVTDTILGITQKAGHELQEKGGESAISLAGGIERADKALQDTQQALGQTDPTIEAMQTAAVEADSTLASLKGSIPELQSTLDRARAQLDAARTAAGEYEGKIQDALAKGASDLATASSQATTALAQAQADLMQTHGRTSAALSQAQGLSGENTVLIGQLQDLADSRPELEPLDPYISDLQSANSRLDSTIASLKQADDALYATLQGVNSLLDTINGQAQQGSRDMADSSEQLRTTISPALNAGLDDYADALGSLGGLVLALEPAIDQARASLGNLGESLTQSKDAAAGASQSLGAIRERLAATLNDIHAVQGSDTVKQLNEFLKIDPAETASFISAPVKLQTTNVYPVKNYGSGVVSFFTSVALWVAGFVFIDLLKMRVEPTGLPRFTQRQAYFGRWLLFMALGVLPPLIVCAGDLLLGIQCENPAAFIFAGLVSGLVYVNLIYALAHAFRYIGKALAVLFLIIQIPGSSGLYPIEMMPGFYQALHPLLPFTYTIDAFRESIGGFYGMDYWIDLAVLVFVFVPIGLFIGIVLGRWGANLTLLLDRDIGHTGLFDGERVPKQMNLRLSTLLQALLHTPEYRTQLRQRVEAFRRRFPKLRLAGWILLAAQFIVTFALMIIIQADVNTKLILLMAAVIGVVAVDTYLIVIAYMRASLNSKMSLLDHADDQLPDEVRQSLNERTGHPDTDRAGA